MLTLAWRCDVAGCSIEFPSNVVGDSMLDRLRADGVTEVILGGHREREFSLEGAYRHVVVSVSRGGGAGHGNI